MRIPSTLEVESLEVYKYPLPSSLLERLDILFLQKPWEKNAGILFPTLTQRVPPTELAVPPQYNGKMLTSPAKIDAIEGTPIFSLPPRMNLVTSFKTQGEPFLLRCSQFLPVKEMNSHWLAEARRPQSRPQLCRQKITSGARSNKKALT